MVVYVTCILVCHTYISPSDDSLLNNNNWLGLAWLPPIPSDLIWFGLVTCRAVLFSFRLIIAWAVSCAHDELGVGLRITRLPFPGA